MTTAVQEFEQYFLRGVCPLLYNNRFVLFVPDTCNTLSPNKTSDGEVCGSYYYKDTNNKTFIRGEINSILISELLNLMIKTPESGTYIKAGYTVAFITVNPFRQFSKALSPRRLSFYIPNSSCIPEYTDRLLQQLFEDRVGTIWSLFKPTFTPLKKAQLLLTEGTSAGEPLSNNFALVSTNNEEVPVLFYKESRCGTMSRDQEVVFDTDYEDLKDLFYNEVI